MDSDRVSPALLKADNGPVAQLLARSGDVEVAVYQQHANGKGGKLDEAASDGSEERA
jgi:hypothetical protein|eukprot:COSAG01_NODE_2730_length_7172_cov_35.156087_7_plen_57_part_00